MTVAEADKIIERLTNACNWHRFDEPGVYEEYKRRLMKYGFAQMDAAVDAVVEKDSRNVPPISELIKACKEHRQTVAEVHNETHCDVCNDKGYVMLTEMAQSGDLQIPYEYVYYCPYCAVGCAQAYTSRPITDVLDDQAIARLKHSNAHPHVMTDAEKEALRKKLESIGLRLPAALDRGDAWEGDANEQCPF